MNFIHYLKERHLKATPQRISVLKILNRHTHPTIDELYEEIKKEFPTISLATVYKNLNILKQTGMVLEVNANGKPKLDIYIHPHAHIVCKNCGAVEDADFQKSVYAYQKEIEQKSQYKIVQLDVTAVVDTCRQCQKVTP